AKMGLLEHLAELRQRLIYAIAWIIVGFVVAWFFHDQLFQWMLVPLQQGAPEIEAAQMHHKDLAEPIYVFLKLSLLAGAFLAAPGILYNIWKFIAPGLYDSERKLVWPFVIFGTLFFLIGASFCYFIVLPYGYNFLLLFSEQVSDPQLMMAEYFSITTKLMFGFGLIFELPVFSMFLSILGVINHRTLLNYWRYAIVVAFLMAALLTPPDIITQSMMAGPLMVLYGLSILVAWVFWKDEE
ncbi:MAG: twin-arginine translocase subunit TatC, partial [Bradymonadaceae bacterium]